MTDCLRDRCTRPAELGDWCPRHAPDPIAVERLVAGDPPASTYPNERVEAVRILARRGLHDRAIAERIGVAERSVCRIRMENGIPAGFDVHVIPGITLERIVGVRKRPARKTPVKEAS